ncbi:MAG: hypothetical protein KGL39_09585 [Patescibacteria group bacterium]|nr:hypothetical protein [Patescibacteria group bacterium]
MIYEIDITDFVHSADPCEYSASRMELGDNAAPITWRNAVDAHDEYQLLNTEDERESFRAYVKTFGAWTAEEIAAWNDAELNALFIQLVSGDLRESGLPSHPKAKDWRAYARLCDKGQISGRIGPGDNGRIYYTIGE